jgi:hypothetical protein
VTPGDAFDAILDAMVSGNDLVVHKPPATKIYNPEHSFLKCEKDFFFGLSGF